MLHQITRDKDRLGAPIRVRLSLLESCSTCTLTRKPNAVAIFPPIFHPVQPSPCDPQHAKYTGLGCSPISLSIATLTTTYLSLLLSFS